MPRPYIQPTPLIRYILCTRVKPNPQNDSPDTVCYRRLLAQIPSPLAGEGWVRGNPNQYKLYPGRCCYAHDDRRPGPDAFVVPRRRARDFRTPRRAALPRPRRPQRRARHPVHHHPPRAGHHLHGRRLRPRQRRNRHRPHGSRTRPAQRLRRTQHRLLRLVARPRRLRPDRARPHRRGPRHAPRGQRPAGRHPARHQVRPPHHGHRGGPRGRPRGVPPAQDRPAPSRGGRDAARDHGRPGRGYAHRIRGLRPARRVRRAGRRGRPHPGRRAASADLGRRRRHIIGGIRAAGAPRRAVAGPRHHHRRGQGRHRRPAPAGPGRAASAQRPRRQDRAQLRRHPRRRHPSRLPRLAGRPARRADRHRPRGTGPQLREHLRRGRRRPHRHGAGGRQAGRVHRAGSPARPWPTRWWPSASAAGTPR